MFGRELGCASAQNGFETESERKEIVALVRWSPGAHGPARRAYAIVLLDDGMAALDVVRIMYVDDALSTSSTGAGVKVAWRICRNSAGKGHRHGYHRLRTPAWVKILMERLDSTTLKIIALVEARFEVVRACRQPRYRRLS